MHETQPPSLLDLIGSLPGRQQLVLRQVADSALRGANVMCAEDPRNPLEILASDALQNHPGIPEGQARVRDAFDILCTGGEV